MSSPPQLYDPHPEISCRHCRPAPLNDPERLERLRRTGLLDAPPDKIFSRLTDLTTELLNAPVALVSLVDDRRQFFSAQTGLAEPWAAKRETPLSHSFCQHVVTSGRPLIIRDSAEDSRVQGNSAIPDLGVLAYAGFPIVAEGETLGSFCAIHGSSHEWTALELKVLREFAETTSNEIELRLELARREAIQENLERSNRDLEGFARAASHDLKEPLRGINGCLQLAQSLTPDLPAEVKELFTHVMDSTGRMTELVNSLYNYSRLTTAPLDEGEVEHRTLVEEATADLKALLEEKGGAVEVEGDLGISYGRKVALRQLWQNIISNGIKFSRDGVAPVIRVSRENDVLIVEDNGIGIAHEHLNEVFGFFRRLNSRKKFPGSGIGLPLCRRIVEDHGGKMWAESQVGKGSSFLFTLPGTA